MTTNKRKTQLRCVYVCVLLRCDHPVDSADLFSFMTFQWLTPLVVHARKRGQLLLDDIWAVSQRDGCHDNSLRWVEFMNEYLRI